MYIKAYFEDKENKEKELKEYTDKTEYFEIGDVKYIRRDFALKHSERFVIKLIFDGKLKIAEGQEQFFDKQINEYLDFLENKKNETI